MVVVLLVLTFTSLLTLTACDPKNPNCLENLLLFLKIKEALARPTAVAPALLADIDLLSDGAVQPGGTIRFSMKASFVSGHGRLTLRLPRGAVLLSPSAAPQGIPPTFVFEDVPANQPIVVEMMAPPLPGDWRELNERIYVSAYDPVTGERTTHAQGIVIYLESASASSISQATPAPATPTPRARPPAAPQETETSASVEVWRVEQFTRGAITMTTKLCQAWFDSMQDDGAFLALRLPVSSTVPTQSHTLPIAFRADISPTMKLVEFPYPYPAVVTASLDYRFEHASFLANNLPADDDEVWMPLGVAPSAIISCPSGINLPPDEWAFKTDIYLDLDAQPRELLKYYCYEGQEEPGTSAIGQLMARALIWALGDAGGGGFFQSEGVTCMGPDRLLLALNPPIELYPMQTGHISPTQRITFTHMIDNWEYYPDEQEMTVTVTYSSTLGLPWEVYRSGSATGPLVPVSGPFQMGFQQYLWLATTIPADTADGPYTLFLTATLETLPDEPADTTDLLWVGDWVAPPPPPQYPSWHFVYLPLVMRQ
jgi:hypothetical protein